MKQRQARVIRYVVYRFDPATKADERVCQKVNKREADERCRKLNHAVLAENPGKPPLSLPLYYVVREFVKQQKSKPKEAAKQ